MDGVADLLQAADQPVGSLGGVGAVEVGGTEVVPLGAIAQHVPSSREHRGGDGDDGLLGAATGAQPLRNLQLQIRLGF